MSRKKMILLVLSIAFSVLSLCAREAEAGSKSGEGETAFAARPYLVSVSVADLDETLKWYREKMGFALVRKMELPEHKLRMAFVDLDGFQLELIEFKQSVPYDAIRKQFPVVDDRAKVQGLGKLAFRVDDIETAAAEMKDKGATFVRDVTDNKEFGERWFMVADNSGNIIQFIQKMK
jgi:methylmalonyl-CoA/ethylmalonyl-CoA epimerase